MSTQTCTVPDTHQSWSMSCFSKANIAITLYSVWKKIFLLGYSIPHMYIYMYMSILYFLTMYTLCRPELWRRMLLIAKQLSNRMRLQIGCDMQPERDDQCFRPKKLILKFFIVKSSIVSKLFIICSSSGMQYKIISVHVRTNVLSSVRHACLLYFYNRLISIRISSITSSCW